MDITELSMDLSQNKLLTQVGTAMLCKSMDVAESQVAMMADSMAMVQQPSLEALTFSTQGTAIDLRV